MKAAVEQFKSELERLPQEVRAELAYFLLRLIHSLDVDRAFSRRLVDYKEEEAMRTRKIARLSLSRETLYFLGTLRNAQADSQQCETRAGFSCAQSCGQTCSPSCGCV
jgi:hypothetical protein